MNRRLLIATVAVLSIGGLTAASAEPDSSGAGGASYGWSNRSAPTYNYSGTGAGYDSYGSADMSSSRATVDQPYLGYRPYRAPSQGNVCLDEDGNRFACR